MNTTIGFVGFGLIGGSIARSLRKVHPEYNIIAYSRSLEPLMEARNDGVVNWICSGIGANFSACDFIFLCTPVSSALGYLADLKTVMKRDCIVTDVGSTKTEINEAIKEMDMEDCYIGGHPMAGSEKTGYHNSTDHLLENCFYILTPTPKTTPAQLERMEALVRDLKAIPMVMNYKEHDYAVATVSHLPHVIASSLVNLVKGEDNSSETMKTIAAGGFKDITRIASASPDMWQQICETNADNISKVLRKYIASLEQIADEIESHKKSDIYNFFEESREYRDSIRDGVKSTIATEYALFCDVPDEIGSITTVAAILSANRLSIKNIGIINNREFQDGVLKIEFYTQTAADNAAKLLTRCQYKIYER